MTLNENTVMNLKGR